ncbi:MAG TPA: hypothetical protein VJT31_35530 [Rugosimonospora sp.]|nr:hypothetical protein [Rugosimonospora sp.]
MPAKRGSAGVVDRTDPTGRRPAADPPGVPQTTLACAALDPKLPPYRGD